MRGQRRTESGRRSPFPSDHPDSGCSRDVPSRNLPAAASVRMILPESTPIRSGPTISRHLGAALGLSMNSSGAKRRPDQARDDLGFFSDQLRDREHLLRRAAPYIRAKARNVADAAIDRNRIPGRADANASTCPFARLSTMKARQHHRRHVLIPDRRHRAAIQNRKLVIMVENGRSCPKVRRAWHHSSRRFATTREARTACCRSDRNGAFSSAVIADATLVDTYGIAIKAELKAQRSGNLDMAEPRLGGDGNRRQHMRGHRTGRC